MQDLIGSHILLNKDGVAKIVPKKEEPLISDSTRHSCDMCQFTSLHSAALKRHKQNLHSDKINVYKCSVCNYVTKYKSSLKRHTDYQHDKSNQKVVKCPLCDYTSSYSSTVERHVQTVHHKSREYSCPHCEYSTVHKFSLDRHVRSLHQEDKSYTCDSCTFSTRRKSLLKLHISTIHEAKKAHKCGVCGFETLYKTALARHITTSSCQTPPQQTLQTPPAPQTQQMPQTPQPQQQRPQTPIIPTQQPQPIQQLQPLQFDHMQPHMLVLKEEPMSGEDMHEDAITMFLTTESLAPHTINTTQDLFTAEVFTTGQYQTMTNTPMIATRSIALPADFTSQHAVGLATALEEFATAAISLVINY